MITKKLRNYIVDLVYDKINSIELIINDTPTAATILNKVKGTGYVDIYVDLLLSSTSDIINGIIVYDSSNNMLAKDLPNLTYNVQSATYVYRLQVTSDKGIL